MSTFDIKYKYALSKSGKAVCIDSLTEKDRDDYECLGCGNILRPVLPNKRQKYFRHKSQQACSTETYLHRMGKKFFIKKYNECLTLNNPYIVELETPVFCNSCQYGRCIDSKKIYFDLTAGFKSIKEEKRDRNLTPDILIETESGEKIYIEIYVTHPSSGEKISSGNKIIEFEIKKEEDLEIFKKEKLDASVDKIRAYNFNLQPKEVPLQSSCRNFHLHRRGKGMFVERYQDCLTFNDHYTIELKVPVYCNSCQYGPCSKGLRKKSYNLTSEFRDIKTEQRNQYLIPDILLENESGDKIYIEIATSCNSSKEKIYSGNMVIEFEIQQEEDLEIFKRNAVDTSGGEARAYNFNLQPEEIQLQDFCQKFHFHKRGKELFVKKYTDCLTSNNPYVIEYEVPVYCNSCQYGPCNKSSKKKSYDLTSNFKEIKAEQRDQYFIPDILLETESGEKIYIEITVAYSFSREKICSENRVIEFEIQKEGDFEIFQIDKISVFDNKIKVYGFNPKSEEAQLKDSCHKKIYYFTVFANGKCRIMTCPIYEWDTIKESRKYVVEVKEKNSDIFIQETEKAFCAGINVKNCFLCRHYEINRFFSTDEESNPIFCNCYGKIKKSNSAANCREYQPDKKVFRSS